MPDSSAISLTPAAVSLRPGDKQSFVAVASPVAAGAASAIVDGNSIEWNLSPSVGTIGLDGAYEAPLEVDDVSVTLTAIEKSSGNQAKAVISLLPPPWRGAGATALGVYILLVFSTMFPLVRLWPVGSLDPVTAKTARLEAEATLTKAKQDLKNAIDGQAPAPAQKSGNQSNSSGATQGKTGGTTGTTGKSTGATGTAGTTPSQPDARDKFIEGLQAQVDLAEHDLEKKKHDETEANSPNVQTTFANPINRGLDLLLLVVLAGMLGAFLHMARSYSDFRGNRTLKRSWLWWYLLQPFLGSALALVMYATLRGGLVSIVPASHTSTTDLNVFGVIALSALAGLFSKAATSKLGEVFGTLFQTDAANKTKDKVDNGTKPPAAPPTGTPTPAPAAPNAHS